MIGRVSLPIFIETGVKKKKKHYLNMNNYRNWHHRVSNQLKKVYTMQVGKLQEFQDLPRITTKCKLTYYIYYPTKRKFDVDNIGAVSGKFFQDTLVNFHKIEDDNYDWIPEIIYKFGDIDKDNPRVDVVIEEI